MSPDTTAEDRITELSRDGLAQRLFIQDLSKDFLAEVRSDDARRIALDAFRIANAFFDVECEIHKPEWDAIRARLKKK